MPVQGVMSSLCFIVHENQQLLVLMLFATFA